MNKENLTLEDIADQVDCLAKNVTRILQLLAKSNNNDRERSKTYIERGYRP